MMRLSPPGFQRFGQARTFDVIYGGGESNVAVSLANFGLPAAFITRLPANDLGDACIAYLRQFGVGVDSIVRGGERLGIYFLEMGAVQRGSKVVYDRAHSSIATVQRGMIDWPAALAGADPDHIAPIKPIGIALMHGGEGRRQDYERFFGCPVDFDAPRSEVRVDAAIIPRRVCTS